jgi:hypothetical protein
LLLRDTSKTTEFEMNRSSADLPTTTIGFQRVLQALARRPMLTKLALYGFRLGRDEAGLIQIALCNMPSLQSLNLAHNPTLETADLRELAPALYTNTSLKAVGWINTFWWRLILRIEV